MSNGFQYAKFYIQGVNALKGLSGKELLMFIYLSNNVKMASNELRLTRKDKDEAASIVGIKPRSVANHLSKFCKLNLMINAGGGLYIVNPSITNRAMKSNTVQLSLNYCKLREEMFSN